MYIFYANILDMWDSHIRKLMFIMRLTIVLILTTMLHINASTFAQKITYVKKDATLHLVFKQIKKQAGYNVVLNDDKFDASRTLNADFKNADLSAVMARVLEGLSFTYTILKKTTVIREKPNVPVSSNMYRDANIDVHGIVHDDQGVPLVGATVTVKGTSQSTKTNEKGEFRLKDVDENSTLLLSHLGYESLEIKVVENMGTIILVPKIDKLLEVEINAGYYTVKDRERTGSISRVSSEAISKQPVNNPLEALIGRMAGVNVEPNTGVNGGGFKVQIRGVNSLRNEAREPLYLLDGVPFPSTRLTYDNLGVGSLLSASPLNYINTADIESVEVLKDADATAIYGSRGANGVVLIKTKRSAKDKSSVNVNVYSGISEVGKKLDLLNTQEYLEMRAEAFKNDGTNPGLTDYDVNGTWDKSRYTDWQEILIGGTAKNTNIQTSIHGGNEFTHFSFRGNLNQQTTVFPGDFADKKSSGTLTIDHTNASRKFKVNFSSSYLTDHNNVPRLDLAGAIFLPPNAPEPYDATGKLNWALNTNGGVSWTNPIAGIFNDYNSKSNSSISNALLDYELVPGLILRSTFGYTNIRLRETLLLPIKALSPAVAQTGTSYLTYNTLATAIIEPQINYKTKLSAGTVDILVGTTFQNNDQKSDVLAGAGFTSDLLLENITVAPTRIAITSASQYKYNAIFGRINYNYDGKYLINLTGRRDGSSRFGPDRQFANFAAIGLAWIFTNERLLKEKMPLLSFGKVRGSYGTTGSDVIPDYGYLSTYTSTQPYQGGSGLIPSRIANPDYSWETNKKLEISLELGFHEDRILFSSNFYRNRSSNQLVGYSLPDLAGFPSIQYNLPATVQNYGWEFEINSVNIIKDSFSWKTGFNLTIPKNKLLSYPNLQGSSNASVYTIGESLFTPISYHYLGVDSETGVYMFEDLNGNGSDLDLADKKSATRALTSTLYGGLQNSISFKGFQLDLFCQFAEKLARHPVSQLGGAGSIYNQPRFILSRWQKPGDQTPVQKFSVSTATGGARQRAGFIGSSDSFTDASFIRIKNVALSWNIPGEWARKAKLHSLRIYIQGQNLLTVTEYIGDPEVTSLTTLPALTTITAGLQVNL